MLRKLLKHEFRATARIMLPLFLVVLLTSVGANLSIRFGLDSSDNALADALYAMVVMAYVTALVSVCIISLVLMIRRFYKNLLRDEGYIMFTLPASIHQHIWSKLIVSTVWFAATALVVTLSVLILVFDMAFVTSVTDLFAFLLRQLNFFYALNGTAMVVELAVLAFLSGAVTSLQFYAAMSIGHSFASRKLLLSVVFYFGLQFAMQSILSVVTMGPASIFMTGLADAMLGWRADNNAMGYLHVVMGLSAVTSILQGAVYYVITAIMLKRRLNLE